LHIEVVEKEGLKREMTVEVPADIVEEKYGKVYDHFRKSAQIKGFRPGKAPLTLIRSRFKDEATAEVIDDLIGDYFDKALREKKLEPVGKPTVSKIDVDEGKPLTFTIGFEIMPTIDRVQYDNLVVEEPVLEVPDGEVDRVLENLRRNRAEIRPVERAAGPADIVICDLEIPDGGVDIGDGALANQEIELDNEYTVREFREGLVGAKRDEEREITIAYPENYSDEKFAGKSVRYRVKIKEVKERILPLINDGFAKLVGFEGTFLELKLDIRRRLEMDVRADAARMRRRSVIDQVVNGNPIVVPEAMVESYLNGVVEDHRKNKLEFEEKEVREKYRPLGVNAVRWHLLYHRLAEQENIEVSSEDTENWTSRFADNYRMDVAKARELLAKSGKAEEIKDGILEDKVVDFLLSKTEVKTTSIKNKDA